MKEQKGRSASIGQGIRVKWGYGEYFSKATREIKFS